MTCLRNDYSGGGIPTAQTWVEGMVNRQLTTKSASGTQLHHTEIDQMWDTLRTYDYLEDKSAPWTSRITAGQALWLEVKSVECHPLLFSATVTADWS